MKKILLFSAIVVLFGSCQKLLEHFPHLPDGEIKKCRIASMRMYIPGQSDYNMTFAYNQYNDPTRVTAVGTQYRYDSVYWEFSYDTLRRLTEFRFYGDYTMPITHRYAYNERNQIVRDSFFTYTPYQGILEELTYDAYNRVSSEKWSYLYSGSGDTGVISDAQQMRYDARGNLMESPYITPRTSEQYDENLSYLRTNRVWMFITRDYSINNPYIARGYTNRLPTGFDQSIDFLYSGQTEIEWDCDE